MKSLICALFVSAMIGSVYADSLNDLQIKVHDGTSFVSFGMTPSTAVDNVLVWDKDSEVYRLADLDPLFNVGGGILNFNSSGIVSSLYGIFASSTHSHIIGNITGLQTALDAKALLSHTHVISDTTGLQGALDDKVSLSLLASATSSISSSIATLQTQVNGISTSSPAITMGVSKSIVTSISATGTLLSSTRVTNVMYSVNVVTTASIGGASAGEVLLEVSPTNTSTSTWTVLNRIKNSQTISLAIALNSVQDLTFTMIGNVPAGYYVRVRSNNISGTPTYSFITGEETQF